MEKLLPVPTTFRLNQNFFLTNSIQGCGSGFSDFVDPDPYWESGSRIRIQGQEN
jgi:hypothetical protein